MELIVEINLKELKQELEYYKNSNLNIDTNVIIEDYVKQVLSHYTDKHKNILEKIKKMLDF